MIIFAELETQDLMIQAVNGTHKDTEFSALHPPDIERFRCLIELILYPVQMYLRTFAILKYVYFHRAPISK